MAIEEVTASWVNPFTDVAESDWFYSAVEYVNRKDLFVGTKADTFSPNEPMTRAMLWTVLGRIDGQKFPESKTLETSRIWAIGAGITDGSNADSSISREQLVTILWRYAGLPKGSSNLSIFSDGESVADYTTEAMSWAVSNAIVVGFNDSLMPQNNATRAQVAIILNRFVELEVK